MGHSARRAEQHGQPRRRRRLGALARGGALRDAGRPARGAGARDRHARGQRRPLPDRQVLRQGLPRRPPGRQPRLRAGGGRGDELLEPSLEPGRRPLRQPRRAHPRGAREPPRVASPGDALPGLRDRREERHADDDLSPRPSTASSGRSAPISRPTCRSSSASFRRPSSMPSRRMPPSATPSRRRPGDCPSPLSPPAARPRSPTTTACTSRPPASSRSEAAMPKPSPAPRETHPQSPFPEPAAVSNRLSRG